MEGVVPLDSIAPQTGGQRVRIGRISEEVQKDETLMTALRRVGALPDCEVSVAEGPVGLLVGAAGETAEIDREVARHIFVRPL
jgi:DtxR family Mn-dependent transcriptional regulator